jgi:hypothetical protein
MDFAHRPMLKKGFRNWMFRSSGTKKVAPTLLGPNRVGVTFLLLDIQ